jgi:hypothetical protein
MIHLRVFIVYELNVFLFSQWNVLCQIKVGYTLPSAIIKSPLLLYIIQLQIFSIYNIYL